MKNSLILTAILLLCIIGQVYAETVKEDKARVATPMKPTYETFKGLLNDYSQQIDIAFLVNRKKSRNDCKVTGNIQE